MMLLRSISLWLHVISMVTWFGGLLFYVAVAAPTVRAVESAAERLRAVRELDQRFRHIIWGSVEAAVVTGIALLLITMFLAGSSMGLSGGYMRVLAAKLFLAAVIIAMQLYNHIKINPRKRALAEEPIGAGPEPAEFAALQSRTQQVYALELVVAAAIVLLGVHLRSVL
jgi:uncharacterized membrane protein